MSSACAVTEAVGWLNADVFLHPSTDGGVEVFSPCTQRYLLLQDLVIPLGKKLRITLGNDPATCDIVLAGPRINGQHAAIVYSEGCYFLQDLGTATGTHINGRKITGIVELRAGDRINLWPHTLRFTDKVSADSSMVSVGQSGLFRLAAS